VALFANRSQAQAALQDLKEAGFALDHIGIATQGQQESLDALENSVEDTTDGATVGALTGGVLGSLVGLLSSLLIPGIGPILVGGVLASLVGAGVGVAAGGIVGALVGMGIPEHEAGRFEAGLRAGGTLVTVSAGSRTTEALAILERHEADLGTGGVDRRVGINESYTGPERRLARV
jgi:hypothetical protein